MSGYSFGQFPAVSLGDSNSHKTWQESAQEINAYLQELYHKKRAAPLYDTVGRVTFQPGGSVAVDEAHIRDGATRVEGWSVMSSITLGAAAQLIGSITVSLPVACWVQFSCMVANSTVFLTTGLEVQEDGVQVDYFRLSPWCAAYCDAGDHTYELWWTGGAAYSIPDVYFALLSWYR